MNRQTRRLEKRLNKKSRSKRRAEARKKATQKQRRIYYINQFKKESPAMVAAIILIVVNILSFAINTTVNAAENVLTDCVDLIADEEMIEGIIEQKGTLMDITVDISKKILTDEEELEEDSIEEKIISTNLAIAIDERILVDPVDIPVAEEIIKEQSEEVSEDDVLFLSRIIVSEMGEFYTKLSYEEALEAAFLTGGVVRNRMDINNLNLQEVAYAPGQYAEETLNNIENEVDPNLWDESVVVIARAILERNEKEVSEELIGESIEIPENLYYQSQKPRGSGTYKVIGIEYFCFK